MQKTLQFKNLNLSNYLDTWEEMRRFTEDRAPHTPDQCWFVQHFPIFTQGQAGKPEHIRDPGGIPVLRSDRGGQVTYHGPGQLIAYLLVDLKSKQLGIKTLTQALEQAVIQLLAEYNIRATTKCKAPGVYVNEAKIASLGLKIRRGCSYHGLSLNVAMDLTPFKRINPCGYPDLQMIQMQDFIPHITLEEVAPKLLQHLMTQLGYTILI